KRLDVFALGQRGHAELVDAERQTPRGMQHLAHEFRLGSAAELGLAEPRDFGLAQRQKANRLGARDGFVGFDEQQGAFEAAQGAPAITTTGGVRSPRASRSRWPHSIVSSASRPIKMPAAASPRGGAGTGSSKSARRPRSASSIAAEA